MAEIVYWACFPRNSIQPAICISMVETEHLMNLDIIGEAEDSARVLMVKDKVDLKKLRRLIEGIAEKVNKLVQSEPEGYYKAELEYLDALGELLEYALKHAIAVELGINLREFMPSDVEERLEERVRVIGVIKPELLMKYKDEAEELGWEKAIEMAEEVLAATAAAA